MKVVIILSCLLLASSSFFCVGMQSHAYPTFYYGYSNTPSYQNNQNNLPTNQNQNQQQPLPPPSPLMVTQQISLFQKTTLEGVGFSLHLVNTFLPALPSIVSIPMDTYHKNLYTLFETTLGTLAAFLEQAYSNSFFLKVSGMQYTNDGNPQFIYPISIAVDFSHAPLLIACKKHFGTPTNFSSVLCPDNNNYITALKKYKLKQAKYFKLAHEWTKKEAGGEVHSYFISEMSKLPRILKILTDPKCYE